MLANSQTSYLIRLHSLPGQNDRRPISAWRWLLPPVAYFLQRQRSDEYRRAVVAAMPVEQQVAFGRFHDQRERAAGGAAGAGEP